MTRIKQLMNNVTWKQTRMFAILVATAVWLGPPVVQAIDAVITIVFRGLVIVGVALVTKHHKAIANWARTSGKEALKEVF